MHQLHDRLSALCFAATAARRVVLELVQSFYLRQRGLCWLRRREGLHPGTETAATAPASPAALASAALGAPAAATQPHAISTETAVTESRAQE